MKYFIIFALTISFAIVGFKQPSGWTFDTSQEQQSLDINQTWQEVLNYAQENLPNEGQLMIKSDGFGYLKVDDNYIHTLFPMLGLTKDKYREPPYFRSKEAPGAHISVFYENENIIPEEVGQYFHFELQKIMIVKSSKNVSYAVLQVSSPELEKLREKYGLNPKLLGHEFHITLAKKTFRK